VATSLMSGGCQCGRIRFEASVHDDNAYLCHCRMCRRATGGVSIAMKGFKKADVRWTTRPPDLFRSSPIAERGFCSECGTPLTFWFPDSETMDVTVGSFDDPSRFRPTHNFSVETVLPHWQDSRDLPGYRLDENPSTRDRWLRACGKLPD
jgi:hypothetical protein